MRRRALAWLLVWVFLCVKCGLLQWSPRPCSICHRTTVKQWLDDEYLAD